MACPELLRALAKHLRFLGRIADALAMLRLLSQPLCRKFLRNKCIMQQWRCFTPSGSTVRCDCHFRKKQNCHGAVLRDGSEI